jgi:trigger factor
VEQLEVELPETLIQQEIRQLIEQTAGQIAQQGMDVKKLFTQDLVRSLVETSRPEAEQRLRRNLALRALAEAETIEVSAADLETRLQEVRRELNQDAAIDQQRLRLAVEDDLLRDRLLEWLETNNTVTEKAPTAESPDQAEAADLVEAADEGEAGVPAAPDGAKKASKDKEKKKDKDKDNEKDKQKASKAKDKD